MDSNDLYIYESVLTYIMQFYKNIAEILNFHVDVPSWIFFPLKYCIFLDQCTVLL